MNLLADENIPFELVEILRSEGHTIRTIFEAGLTGHADEDILDYAISNGLTILTEDKDFGYLLEFSPSHNESRAILLRFERIEINLIAEQLSAAMRKVEKESPSGKMMAVISFGKLRIRDWKG